MAIESTDASFKLQDRTALITGPCNSLTQALTSKFTVLGANVVLLDATTIDKSKRFADQVMDAREINERYGRAVAMPLDLTRPDTIPESASRAAEVFGGIDILIDASLTYEPQNFKDASTIARLSHLIDVNLRAPLLVAHGVLKFLEGRKRGRVIFLVNDLARVGTQGYGLMAATRSGLCEFTRSLARESLDKNITVNCVAIGVSEDLLQARGGASIQEAQTHLLQQVPYAQMVEPERIASLVAFLASPLAASITGQTIAVSHGMSFLS